MKCKIIMLLMLTVFSLGVSAQSRQEMFEKTKGKLYVFGFSTNFNDSVVYVSSITEVDSIALMKKTGFLPFRSEFSLQFKEYLEGKKGEKSQTSCVFFSENRSRLAKKLYKIKKRYLDSKSYTLVTVPESDFGFHHPLD